MTNNNSRPRVVITGLGAISPLGTSVKLLWDGWMEGKSGVRRISQFDPSDFPCQIAGEIPDFDPTDYMHRRDARRLPRSSQVALAAAMEAVADAQLPDVMPDGERCGVLYGTSTSGVSRMVEGLKIYQTEGLRKVSPFMLPSGTPNFPAFVITERYKCYGPNNTISTACATGTQAVGEASELIRRGAADLVFTGGVDALVTDFIIGGFSIMRALPVNYNDNPGAASRPFDAKREGFIYSEGAAVLILESLEHAKNRGAHIYAEVLGHSSSADAFHMAAPDPDGAGAVRTMKWALEDAGVQPEEIDYINAHGSSTPLNDAIETSAIKKVFGDHAYKLAVSSTKSMIGHAMAASGALEAIACILAIHEGWIPPTINYEYPDPECDLDYVPNKARKAKVTTTLSNSFGLGGQNACLVLKEFTE